MRRWATGRHRRRSGPGRRGGRADLNEGVDVHGNAPRASGGNSPATARPAHRRLGVAGRHGTAWNLCRSHERASADRHADARIPALLINVAADAKPRAGPPPRREVSHRRSVLAPRDRHGADHAPYRIRVGTGRTPRFRGRDGSAAVVTRAHTLLTADQAVHSPNRTSIHAPFVLEVQSTFEKISGFSFDLERMVGYSHPRADRTAQTTDRRLSGGVPVGASVGWAGDCSNV